MGYDCKVSLGRAFPLEDVNEFLEMLGFHRRSKDWYYHFADNDYLSLSGVGASPNPVSKGRVAAVYLHTQAFCSHYDIDKLNRVARQLCKRFGGAFVSDAGKGRYIRLDTPVRTKAEAGCYQAYFHFENNITTAEVYIKYVRFDTKMPPVGTFPEVDRMNPSVISGNILVPFLVSIMEEYFRSCYIALLKYSGNRKSIFKTARVQPHDLAAVGAGGPTIEEAVSRGLNFQNIERVCDNFAALDKRLDIGRALRRPYRRRKSSLFDSMQALVEQRHQLIHRHEIRTDCTHETLQKDIDNVKAAVVRVRDQLIQTYVWHQWSW